jgi:hypothetical protein
MVRDAAPAGLSRASRRLTAVVAGWSGVLGLLLFLAPGWAAPRFAWNVSALVVMTVGGWLLGNCYWATRVVHEWSWARWSSGLGYLWGFAVLQTVVLVVYADKVRPESPVAWLYLGLIGLTDVAAVVGVVDVLRLRPLADEPGPPVPAGCGSSWWVSSAS